MKEMMLALFRFSRRHVFLSGLVVVACTLLPLEVLTGHWETVPATLFSATTAWFSYLAYRFSEDRFRLDLLDRRWVIYESVVDFCSRLIQEGRLRFDEESRQRTIAVLKAAESSFRGIGFHKSKALFGPDVIALLEKLNKTFSWLSAFDTAPHDPQERQQWAEDWGRHASFIWVTVNALPEIFKLYVYFGDYKRR
jgi:hypothetical protein